MVTTGAVGSRMTVRITVVVRVTLSVAMIRIELVPMTRATFAARDGPGPGREPASRRRVVDDAPMKARGTR